MELPIAGKAGSKITVSDGSFGCPYNEGLVHQVVTAYLATGRAGTAAQKTRAERRGGGTKPWRQKGTGRARAGSIRSPIWQGGGVTFAAKNRDYSQKVNRKMHRRAMAVIFSELVRQDRLIIVEELTLSAPKTRELVEKLKGLASEPALCVTESEDRHLSLAARNLPGVNTSHVAVLDPVELVRYEKIIMTVDALKKIEEKLS